MKRRHFLPPAILLVALGVLWYFGYLARFGLGSSPAIRRARARAAGFSRTVRVEPYGLVASVPESFACKHRVETTCRSSGDTPVGVEWSIEPVEARKAPPGSSDDAEIKEGVMAHQSLVGVVTLAGFEGFVVSWQENRGLNRGCTFTGWLEDPTRGLLRLTVEADAMCDTHPDVLGVVVSTREADPKAKGPAKFWPDDAKRAVQARLAEHFDQLADDQAPAHQWSRALGAIVERRDSSSPLAGEALRARQNPGVSELAKRRIESLTGGGSFEQLQEAWTLVRRLEVWDRPSALPLRKPIAEKARALATSAGTASTREARLTRGLDCDITESLARDEPGSSSALALARVLERAGLLELHASFHCASTLWNLRSVPEIAALLERWHDPKNIPVPADLDYLDLAEFAEAHYQKHPLLRRHALAMLQNKSPGGRLTVRENNYTVESKHRSFGTGENVGWGLPADGTTIPMRVCDIYGIRFAYRFVPYAPIAARDAWIEDAIAKLREPSAQR